VRLGDENDGRTTLFHDAEQSRRGNLGFERVATLRQLVASPQHSVASELKPTRTKSAAKQVRQKLTFTVLGT